MDNGIFGNLADLAIRAYGFFAMDRWEAEPQRSRTFSQRSLTDFGNLAVDGASSGVYHDLRHDGKGNRDTLIITEALSCGLSTTNPCIFMVRFWYRGLRNGFKVAAMPPF